MRGTRSIWTTESKRTAAGPFRRSIDCPTIWELESPLPQARLGSALPCGFFPDDLPAAGKWKKAQRRPQRGTAPVARGHRCSWPLDLVNQIHGPARAGVTWSTTAPEAEMSAVEAALRGMELCGSRSQTPPSRAR